MRFVNAIKPLEEKKKVIEKIKDLHEHTRRQLEVMSMLIKPIQDAYNAERAVLKSEISIEEFLAVEKGKAEFMKKFSEMLENEYRTDDWQPSSVEDFTDEGL